MVSEYFGRGLFNKALQEATDVSIPTLEADLFKDLGLTPVKLK